MNPEVYFLKYAFPCSFILRQRNEISQQQYDQLEKSAINNITLPKELLEKTFHRAFERIEKLASKNNKDKWDLDIIKQYFLQHHNELINDGMYTYAEAPETLKELCKVKKAKVTEIKDDILIVEIENKPRPVMNSLTPNAKIGDLITIHYGYAVEVLNQ
tara:strand:+ start:2352 stop:2828 length:477 start_codon:yes stop_codon:yes gene_type:complete